MKRLILLLLLGNALISCKKEGDTPGPATIIGQIIPLAPQESAVLPASSGGPVRVTLTEIVDARCPTGSQCIWEGYVAVTATLTDAANNSQTARIALASREILSYTRDSVAVTLNQRTYWLRLLAVNNSSSSSSKTALLRLRPQ